MLFRGFNKEYKAALPRSCLHYKTCLITQLYELLICDMYIHTLKGEARIHIWRSVFKIILLTLLHCVILWISLK